MRDIPARGAPGVSRVVFGIGRAVPQGGRAPSALKAWRASPGMASGG